MSDALYTVEALSTGGGRDGHVATADMAVDLEMAPPKELGGSGEGNNPEQEWDLKPFIPYTLAPDALR